MNDTSDKLAPLLEEFLGSLPLETRKEVTDWRGIRPEDLAKPTEKQAAAYLRKFQERNQTVPAGARNNTLFRYAARLRRCGLTGPAILESLWSFSDTCCEPPYDRSNPGDVKELAKLARNALNYVPVGFPKNEKKTDGAAPAEPPGSPVIEDALLMDWLSRKKASGEPVGVDPENTTGEEIKAMIRDGFAVNSADIGAGDTALEIVLAFLGGRELAGDGLHCKVSGEQSSGKTVTVNAALANITPTVVYAGAFSPKAVLYDDNLKSGTIIKIDEGQELCEDFLNIMKESISNFQQPIPYWTVVNQVTVRRLLPARLTWVLIGVDNIGDEQTLSRLFPVGIDSRGKHGVVTQFRLGRREIGREKNAVTDEVMKVRFALTHYLDKRFRAIIPYATDIVYKSAVEKDQRLQEFFETCIMYHAVLCYREREHTLNDGVITVYADKKDFEEVSKLRIFNRPFESTNRLLPSEVTLIADIVKHGLHLYGDTPVPRGRLLELGYSQSRLSNILTGRNKAENGLLSKVPGLEELSQNTVISEDDGSRLVEKCRKSEVAYRIPENIKSMLNEGIESAVQSIASCDFEKARRTTEESSQVHAIFGKTREGVVK